MTIDDFADDGEGTGRSFGACIAGDVRDRMTEEHSGEMWRSFQRSIRLIPATDEEWIGT